MRPAGWRVLLPLAAACALVGCRQASPPAPAVNWNAERDAFIEAEFEASPGFAVIQGRHEFDGRIGDFSRAGIEANVARLKRAAMRFRAMADVGLDEAQRFERQYLLQMIDGELFWLDTVGEPYRNPIWYLDQIEPAPYLERDYAPLAQRLDGYVGLLHEIPQVLAQARENLRLPLVRSFVERSADDARGFASFFEGDARRTFDPVTDPVRRAAFDAATREAAASMRSFALWLDAQRASATEDFALGATRFAGMLRATEGVTMPLAAIKVAGESDLARNHAALEAACARFAPRRTLVQCIGRMRAHKTPGGPVAGARAQLDGLRDFLETKDIVSVPGQDVAQVAETPPYRRGLGAYINIPGPYEKGQPSVYYIEPPDPAWSRREQQDYIMGDAELLNTSVHEVWPGHFLQFLHATRSASPVARLYWSYAFAEGWAHYAEELMLEAGLREGDPEFAVAQASDALLRDVRFLSAIGLHTEGMTVAQSERLFRERAFQGAATAHQQAARGTFDPAYLNYTLGKLMIRRLREDWTATRGGRAAWKAFHDEFLSHGSPPIPLLRRAMLGSDTGPQL